MKKYIIIFLAMLFVLVGCQGISEPSQANQGNFSGKPPLIISLHSVEELHQLKEIIKSRDEKKIQETLLAQGLSSEEDIINFLRVIDSLPLLKIMDGEISGITYQLGKIVDIDENGNYCETDQRQEIVYITTQSDDGSWARISYALAEKDLPLTEILKESDQESSLIKEHLLAANDRCLVYFETRTPNATDSGEIITWLAVVDGIPVRIKYHTETANDIKAETLFQNATISSIPIG